MSNAEGGPRLIDTVLVRYPALRADAGAGEGAGLLDAALALEGKDGLSGERGDRARARYAARLRFRSTPRGLFAAVAVGRLGEATALGSDGPMRPVVSAPYAGLAALARALLDDEAVRLRSSLCAAPSWILDRAGGFITWLAPGRGAPRARVLSAPLDSVLATVVRTLEGRGARGRSFRAVRAALLEAGAAQGAAAPDTAAADDLLLVLLDEGFVLSDLMPPLIGEAPLSFLRRRLSSVPAARQALKRLDSLAKSLAVIERADDSASLLAARSAASAALPALPGGDVSEAGPRLDAVLVGAPRRATIAREEVARAAALAPLLFRLQAALGAPAERRTSARMERGLAALVERRGAGDYAIADLLHGRHQVELERGQAATLAPELPDEDDAPDPPPAPSPLLALLAAALAEGTDAVCLDPAALEAALEEGEAPPTFELFLAPARAGIPWLLGLHAPAGSTWGRFANALGEALAPGFADLLEGERACFDEEVVDLAYAPSSAVADVACHPPLRRRAVALSDWPSGGRGIACGALSLRLDERIARAGLAAEGALGLLDDRGAPVVIAPLARLRATTVARDGLHRLIAASSLRPQSAPWAMGWGPFARLPRLPRVEVDGFVIAPASFAIPAAVRVACAHGGAAARAAIAAWREAARVPRTVQIGDEDLLLPVDLEADEAARALCGEALRVTEIWPPLDGLADVDGRRVEIVAAVAGPGRRRAEATRRRPRPLDPRGDAGVRTLLVHGPAARADLVLMEAIAPALSGEAWWLLRYIDPDGRPHLRVRVRGGRGARSVARLDAALARLAGALAPLRATGDVVAIETVEHFAETERLGGPAAVAGVEAIFAADSALLIALLAREGSSTPSAGPPGEVLLARAFDALAAGLGLDAKARAALASSTRSACAGLLDGFSDEKALARLYRARQAELASGLSGDALGGRGADEVTEALRAYRKRITQVAARLRRAGALSDVCAALPTLLHLLANRLAGTDARAEALGHYAWQRGAEGRLARAREGALSSPRRRTSAPARRAAGTPLTGSSPARGTPRRSRRPTRR